MKRSPTDSYFVQVEYSWLGPDGREYNRKRVTPAYYSRAESLGDMYHEYKDELKAEFTSLLSDGYMRALTITQFHAEPNELEE